MNLPYNPLMQRNFISVCCRERTLGSSDREVCAAVCGQCQCMSIGILGMLKGVCFRTENEKGKRVFPLFLCSHLDQFSIKTTASELSGEGFWISQEGWTKELESMVILLTNTKQEKGPPNVFLLLWSCYRVCSGLHPWAILKMYDVWSTLRYLSPHNFATSILFSRDGWYPVAMDGIL